MKKTKIIIILSTIAIFGTVSVIYYYYRRNKTLLDEVKQLRKDAWCEKHRLVPDQHDEGVNNVVGDSGNFEGHEAPAQASLNSLRNEIASLENMISSSEEESESSSDEDVNSEALLKDILGDSPYEINNNVNEVIEQDINPLQSYHLDDNENNDNLEYYDKTENLVKKLENWLFCEYL